MNVNYNLYVFSGFKGKSPPKICAVFLRFAVCWLFLSLPISTAQVIGVCVIANTELGHCKTPPLMQSFQYE